MDPETINTLASSAIAILSPYLAKAADAIVPKAAEELYNAIKARFSTKPTTQEALNDFEKAPDDADAQAAVRLQLRKLLTEDEAFASEFETLIKNAEVAGARPGVSATGRGVAAGRDVSGTVLTGDVKGSVTVERPDDKSKS